ncbi:MAG: hypothetical protein NZT92_07530 [Abditibacteriales bacterium]|nr:hypothetical protein [Abditibacteriales bacterium]
MATGHEGHRQMSPVLRLYRSPVACCTGDLDRNPAIIEPPISHRRVRLGEPFARDPFGETLRQAQSRIGGQVLRRLDESGFRHTQT